MAKRHFDKDSRPNLPQIIEEIMSLLANQGAKLAEIYLVGGYGVGIQEASKTEPLKDLQLLMDKVNKTAGDVDLLVSYSVENGVAEIAHEDILNELNTGAHPITKDWHVDIVFFAKPIDRRRNPICRIFPSFNPDCANT